MDKQLQSRAPLIIAMVLLLLPVLYVGSYLALVLPPPSISTPYNEILARRWSNYRAGGRFAEIVFWPLEQIDRKLRPGAWDKLQQLDNALKSYRRH
jgi:hypothetical protein